MTVHLDQAAFRPRWSDARWHEHNLQAGRVRSAYEKSPF